MVDAVVVVVGQPGGAFAEAPRRGHVERFESAADPEIVFSVGHELVGSASRRLGHSSGQ